MFLSDLFKQKKAVLSFEIFPPKQSTSIEVIYETIDGLAPLRPDYISVTYGAGGSTSKTTAEIASIIKEKYNICSLAHITCYDAVKDQIDGLLNDLKHKKVQNILALRGDKPQGAEAGDLSRREFRYASDLARYIKEKHDFCLAGACYPEGHPESCDLDQDVRNLGRKVEAGVGFLITQLFFDNEVFYRFQEKVAKENIRIPIQVGIMPVTNRKQIETIIKLTNVKIPPKLIRIMDKFQHNSEAIKDAGIAYATEQIVELLAHDINGVHIYTMNRPQVAKAMVRNLDSLLYSVNH